MATRSYPIAAAPTFEQLQNAAEKGSSVTLVFTERGQKKQVPHYPRFPLESPWTQEITTQGGFIGLGIGYARYRFIGGRVGGTIEIEE